MHRQVRHLAGLATLSMCIAGGIYVLFRNESIILFDWLQWLQLMPVIAELRSITLPMAQQCPDWVLYSLPDGLWLLSYLFFVRVVWDDGDHRSMWMWAGAGLVVGFGHELLQVLGVVAGTFDWRDVLAYWMASVVALGPVWAKQRG